MPRVRVNFGDVEEFEAIPEGVYEAVIEKVEFREAKEKGKHPYLNVEYTITEPEEFAGRKVWEILSWSPKALFRMRDFFNSAGFDWDDEEDHDFDIDDESNLLLDPDLQGEAVTLTIENEIYNKKEVNRVIATEFASPPGGDYEAPEPEEDEDAEDEDDDAEDEEVEEEEEAPKKRAPARSTKAKTTTSKKRTFR